MPKQVNVLAQRQMIGDAVIGVIGKAGLENLRLKDVARLARVTTGAITHYFDSKDEVLEAALAQIVNRTVERMEKGRPVVAGNVERFLQGVCAFLPLDEASREEWRVWLAFWGRAMGDSHLRAVHGTYYARIADRIAGLLDQLEGARPGHKSRNKSELADALIAAIDGVGTRATLEPGAWSAARQRKTLRRLLRPVLLEFSTNHQ